MGLQDVDDPYSPSDDQADACAALIVDLEQRTSDALASGRPNPLLLIEGRPAFRSWQPLTKRAIALTNIYNPDASHLGSGIDPSVYDERLFHRNGDRASAAEVLLTQIGPARASAVTSNYRDFIKTAIDEDSRLIWKASLDGRGVRTRAQAATEVVERWASCRRREAPIRLASLACGAAIPVLSMVGGLKDTGHEVDEVLLADNDPMALATAHSIASTREMTAETTLLLQSLVADDGAATDLSIQIGRASVDVVDLLGLFEYFPEPLAIEVLRQVRSLLRPGGILVLGNMLDQRPQQYFFTHVSLWPPLFQRSLSLLVRILGEAGFDLRGVEMTVPPEGVYAVVSATT